MKGLSLSLALQNYQNICKKVGWLTIVVGQWVNFLTYIVIAREGSTRESSPDWLHRGAFYCSTKCELFYSNLLGNILKRLLKTSIFDNFQFLNYKNKFLITPTFWLKFNIGCFSMLNLDLNVGVLSNHLF